MYYRCPQCGYTASKPEPRAENCPSCKTVLLSPAPWAVTYEDVLAFSVLILIIAAAFVFAFGGAR